jgi:hypothetical protein
LLGERAARGQPEERQYYWSNLPASATLEELVDVAHRRYAVEQFHEEAKGERGWDQYQGRWWPGFHRHAVSTITDGVAHATLFPPRPDRHRGTLPAVHREVALWLRHQALLWWMTTDRFMELCSLRF